ncbi:MAG: SLBB domain-containing protein [Phycisphaerae bacterium]|nr:polysaccharide biosynthesis/export family protein [Phycisphaerae bacterium]NUQ46177.1 SLBB domain-containing protein [Phycisphaerae bacterium]
MDDRGGKSNNGFRISRGRHAWMAPALAWLACSGMACERAWWNGFLDLSQVGRFKSDTHRREVRRTLSSLIDEPEGIPGATTPTSEDLVVAYAETPIEAGDILDISIFELLAVNTDYRVSRTVNEVGYISLPELGPLKVGGTTPRELELDLIHRLKESERLADPQVHVAVLQSQAKRCTVHGAARAGTYPLPRPGYRLLDLLADAGGLAPTIKTVYVYRTTRPEPKATPEVERLFESRPATRDSTSGAAETAPVSPFAEFNFEPTPAAPTSAPPGGDEAFPPVSGQPPATTSADAPEEFETPPIEPLLPPPSTKPEEATLEELEAAFQPASRVARPVWDETRGGWVLVEEPPSTGPETAESAPSTSPDQQVPVPEGVEGEAATGPSAPTTQTTPTMPGIDWEGLSEPEETTRVIAIATEPLMNGDPRYNIVIRSSDVINVSPGAVGEFYLMGNIARPGAYSLTGREVTIREAIAAAGGFGPLATPSRAELIRRGANDEEEIRMIDLDAIFAGEADNFFLKPNDIINVGTHPVMPFLATIRNAFRVSYGFGFVYDRNFADIDSYGGQQNPDTRRRQERLQRGFPP